VITTKGDEIIKPVSWSSISYTEAGKVAVLEIRYNVMMDAPLVVDDLGDDEEDGFTCSDDECGDNC